MSLSELFTYSDIIIENQGKAIETYLTYEIGLNSQKQIKNHQKISPVPTLSEILLRVAMMLKMMVFVVTHSLYRHYRKQKHFLLTNNGWLAAFSKTLVSYQWRSVITNPDNYLMHSHDIIWLSKRRQGYRAKQLIYSIQIGWSSTGSKTHSCNTTAQCPTMIIKTNPCSRYCIRVKPLNQASWLRW